MLSAWIYKEISVMNDNIVISAKVVSASTAGSEINPESQLLLATQTGSIVAILLALTLLIKALTALVEAARS